MNTAERIAFLVYSLLWDVFCFGGAAYLIVQHGWSPWWFLAAVLAGGLQIMPKRARQ